MTPLDPARVHELIRDPRRVAKTFLRIVKKSGGYAAFAANPAQTLVLDVVVEARKKNRPARVKVLKYRQGGISTISQWVMQHAAQCHTGYFSMSIADKEDLPAQWLRRSKRWHSELPECLRPHLAASNAMELWFDRLDSRYFIGSAKGQTPGMGYTIRGIHASELSNWPNPAGVFDNLLPALPKDDPESVVLMESTGELAGDWWCESWNASQRGEDDGQALFLPWTLQPEYRMDDSDIVDLTSEEQSLINTFGLDRQQIAWRRWTIRNEFEGDLQRFRSKYPLIPEEAFMGVGSCAIAPEIIAWHEKNVTEPKRYRLMENAAGEVSAIEHLGPGPAWEIWDFPKDLYSYTIGGDVAEGALSDRADPQSERDNSAAAVLCRENQRLAAQWVGQIPPDDFGRELLKAAKFYKQAWLCPEINNHGWSTLTVIKAAQYPHVFRREGPMDDRSEVSLDKLGWKNSNDGARDFLIDTYLRACMPDAVSGFDGKLFSRSKRLLNEERTFIVTKTGKREHRSGCHDDLIFGLALAVMADRRCPRVTADVPKVIPYGSFEWRRRSALVTRANQSEDGW